MEKRGANEGFGITHHQQGHPLSAGVSPVHSRSPAHQLWGATPGSTQQQQQQQQQMHMQHQQQQQHAQQQQQAQVRYQQQMSPMSMLHAQRQMAAAQYRMQQQRQQYGTYPGRPGARPQQKPFMQHTQQQHINAPSNPHYTSQTASFSRPGSTPLAPRPNSPPPAIPRAHSGAPDGGASLDHLASAFESTGFGSSTQQQQRPQAAAFDPFASVTFNDHTENAKKTEKKNAKKDVFDSLGEFSGF